MLRRTVIFNIPIPYHGSHVLTTSKGQEVPEHIQSHLDEIHRTANAAEAAIKVDNTELATELKAKLKQLFENAPEETKTRGFIGSGGNNIPVPPKDST